MSDQIEQIAKRSSAHQILVEADFSLEVAALRISERCKLTLADCATRLESATFSTESEKLSNVVLEVSPEIRKLCREVEAALLPLALDDPRIPGIKQSVHDLRESLTGLTSMVDLAERYGLMPADHVLVPEDPKGVSLQLILSAIVQRCDGTLELVNSLSDSLEELRAERPKPPERRALAEKIAAAACAILPDPDPMDDPGTNAAVLSAMNGRTGSQPDSMNAEIRTDRRGKPREAAEIVESLDPLLHTKLLVEGTYLPAGTDCSMVRVEPLLEATASRKPKLWQVAECGDEIYDGAPISGQADLAFDVSGRKVFNFGVPQGYGLEAVEFRDANDEVVMPSDPKAVRQSAFGSGVAKIPPNAVEMLIRVEADVGKEVSRPIVKLLRECAPLLHAPLDRGLAAVIEEARREPDMRERAQMVAKAFAAMNPLYTTDPEIGKLFKAAGKNQLALMNGMNTGSCVTLSFQLANLLNLAGVPAVIDVGPVTNPGDDHYRTDPGHALVRCFTPQPLTFDPTSCASQATGIDCARIGKSEWEYIRGDLEGMTPSEAWQLGRKLRERISVDIKSTARSQQPESAGHSIQDDLDMGRSSRVDRIIKEQSLGEDLGKAMEELKRGNVDSLCQLFDKHVRTLGNHFKRDAAELTGGEPASLLAEALVSAANDPNLPALARLKIVRKVADELKGLMLDSADYSPILGVFDALGPEIYPNPDPRGTDAMIRNSIAEALQRPAEDERSVRAWRGLLAIYCKQVDSLIEAVTDAPDQVDDRLPVRELSNIVRAHESALDIARDPELADGVEALASRFRRITCMLGLSCADLFLSGNREDGHYQGPWTASWQDMLKSQQPFAASFGPDGRPTQELSSELSDRLASMIPHGRVSEAVAMARDWQRTFDLAPGAIDLSPYRDEITAHAREYLIKTSAISYPDDTQPLARWIFESGISENRFDILVRELHALGGLDLEALRDDWPSSYPTLVPIMIFLDNLQRVDSASHVLDMTAEIDTQTAQSAGSAVRRVWGDCWMLYLSNLAPASFDSASVRLARLLDGIPREQSLDERALRQMRELDEGIFGATISRVQELAAEEGHPRPNSDVIMDSLLSILPNPHEALYLGTQAALRAYVGFRREATDQALPSPGRIARERLGQIFSDIQAIDTDCDQDELGRRLSAAGADVFAPALDNLSGPAERMVVLSNLAEEWSRTLLDLDLDGRHIDPSQPSQGGFSMLRACFLSDVNLEETVYGAALTPGTEHRKELLLRQLAYVRENHTYGIDDETVREELSNVIARLPNTKSQTGWASMLSLPEGKGSRKTPDRTDNHIGNREYRAGDNIAHVDWRAVGRTDRLLVKEFAGGTPNQVKQIDLRIDIEALRSDHDRPNGNIRKIYEMISSAHHQNKEITINLYLEGVQVWGLTSAEVRRDFALAKPDGSLPGEGLFGALWRIGHDGDEKARNFDFNLEFDGIAIDQHESRAPQRPAKPGTVLTVLACHPKNVAASLSRAAGRPGEVKLLDCDDERP